MKTVGIVLLFLGLAGVIIFGLQAINNSEAFNFLGINVAVSSANWTPVIVSGIVMIIGLVMRVAKKK